MLVGSLKQPNEDDQIAYKKVFRYSRGMLTERPRDKNKTPLTHLYSTFEKAGTRDTIKTSAQGTPTTNMKISLRSK